MYSFVVQIVVYNVASKTVTTQNKFLCH